MTIPLPKLAITILLSNLPVRSPIALWNEISLRSNTVAGIVDKHIPGSPFKVHIDNPVDSSRVRAYGPGVEPNKVRANTPANFKIDATKSGRAPVAVDVTSDRGAVAKRPEVYDNGDGEMIEYHLYIFYCLMHDFLFICSVSRDPV